MATERLPSFAEVFAKYAPKFAEIEMVPGGFYNLDNRNEFFLQPARLGTPLHFGYSGCEGGPPRWPFIDVAKAGLRISFNFEGLDASGALTPYEALRKAAYQAIQEQLFPGRVFRLKTVKPEPRSSLFGELSLEIVVEGDPIPGWVGKSHMWAKPSEFFDRSSPEYRALCGAFAYEYHERVKAQREREPVVTASEIEEVLREALAALPT